MRLFQNHYLKHFIFISFVFSVILFSSCSNFLQGSHLQTELEEQIAFANGESCKITFKPKQEGSGSFLSGEKEVKVGFPVEIQFNTSSLYSFEGLVAIRSSTGQLVNNGFTTKLISSEYEIASGVYKFEFTVNKSISDMTVIAECKLKTDIVSPFLKSINLYNTQDTSHPYYKELSSKAFSEGWTDDDKTQNYTDTVYVKITGIDADSGVSYVRIRERLVEDASGTAGTDQEYISYAGLDENGQSLFVLENSVTSTYSYSFNYTCSSKDNGIISLDFELVDKAGNISSSKHFDINKETLVFGCSRFYNTFITDSKPVIPKFNPSSQKYEDSLTIYECFIKSYKKEFVESFIQDGATRTIYKLKDQKITVKVKNQNDSEYTTLINQEILLGLNTGNTSLTDIANLINKKLESLNFVHYADEETTFLLQFWGETGFYVEKEFVIPVRDFPGILDDSRTRLYLNSKDVGSAYKKYYSIYYSFQKDENSEPSEYLTLDSWSLADTSIKVSECYKDDGIYKFYTNYRLQGNTSNNSDSFLYSSFSLPVIDYYNVDYEKTSFSFPEFSVDEESKQYLPNEGKIKISVNVDFPDDSNTYYIKWRSSRATQLYGLYTQKKTVTLDCEASYYVSLIAYDSNGVLLGVSEEKETKGYGEDVFAPVFKEMGQTIETPDSITEQFILYDKTTPSKNEYDINTFKYYFVPVSYGQGVTREFVTSNFKGYTADFTPSASTSDVVTIKIPYDGLPNDKYYIFIEAQDNSQYKNTLFSYLNYSSYIRKFEKALINKKADINYEGENLTVSIPKYLNIRNSVKNFFSGWNGGTDYFLNPVVSYYYLSPSNNWVLGERNKVMAEPDDSKNAELNFNISDLCSYTNENSESVTSAFVKLYSLYFFHYKETPSQSYYYEDACFYLPSYICPQYYKDSIECDKKAWVEVSNGKLIFCDAPCFVHTMYCSKKLTDTTTSLDAAYWEAQGQETAIMCKSKDFSYDNDLLSEIPENYYYTTIMHYADGTVLMSEPEIMHK